VSRPSPPTTRRPSSPQHAWHGWRERRRRVERCWPDPAAHLPCGWRVVVAASRRQQSGGCGGHCRWCWRWRGL
jgi:hypothetical protein